MMGLKNQEHFTASAGPGYWLPTLPACYSEYVKTCLFTNGNKANVSVNPSVSREGESEKEGLLEDEDQTVWLCRAGCTSSCSFG